MSLCECVQHPQRFDYIRFSDSIEMKAQSLAEYRIPPGADRPEAAWKAFIL